MEEIIGTPIDEYLKTAVAPEETYWFEFNDLGFVIALHPGHVVDNIVNKIKIDNDLAQEVYKGSLSLKHYRFDITTGTLQKIDLTDINGLTKIDNVLHRVVDKHWSKISKPDVAIEYNQKENLLTFKLNPLLKIADWHGDKDMIFLVTGYNDPNCLHTMIDINVNELAKYPHKFSYKSSGKFSIYTRRLFDKYTFEMI